MPCPPRGDARDDHRFSNVVIVHVCAYIAVALIALAALKASCGRQ